MIKYGQQILQIIIISIFDKINDASIVDALKNLFSNKKQLRTSARYPEAWDKSEVYASPDRK